MSQQKIKYTVDSMVEVLLKMDAQIIHGSDVFKQAAETITTLTARVKELEELEELEVTLKEQVKSLQTRKRSIWEVQNESLQRRLDASMAHRTALLEAARVSIGILACPYSDDQCGQCQQCRAKAALAKAVDAVEGNHHA